MQRGIVDCHAHTVPEELLAGLADTTDPDGVTVRAVPDGWVVQLPGQTERLVRRKMASAKLRLATIAEQGIEAQLVAPWLDVQPTEAMAPAAARSWARRLNEALAEYAGDADVGQLATVALTDADAAAADLEAAVRDGFAGLVLSTDPAHCENLADPRLEPLWAAVDSLGVPVMLHPSAEGPSRGLPDSAAFGNAYCRLVDTSFAIARLILAGVLDRHPRLRLITVHGGGFLAFQGARLDGAHRADALAGFTIERDRPSDYLGDLFYDTVALSAPAIRFLVDLVGAPHVLLGTDYPFGVGDPQPVTTIRSLALSAAEEAAVLGGNLCALLEARS
jgi:aminocarboxymuconate-semialdehyde decarboxylase